MKAVRVMLLTLALAVAASAIASAQTCTPRIDRRQARQHARIRHGVMTGELTRGEAVRLRMRERRIERLEWRAKADGFVTPRERLRLGRALNRTGRAIWLEAHDDETR